MKKTSALLLLALLSLLAGPAGAQSDDEIQILSVDTDEYPEIALVVAIPPELGDGPLTGSDFAITEQGTPRPTAIRSIRDDIEVVLAIDTSGSMRPNDALERAKAAALSLVDGLPEGTPVGVVGFGSEVLVASPMTGDRSATFDAISSLDFSGDTALWDALVVSADVFEAESNVSRYVVVLTDGVDDGSTSPSQEAAEALRAVDASLYSVGLQTGNADFGALEQVTLEIGGGFASADSLEALQPLYAEIAERLASRYRLVFDATGSGEREIVISVATEGGLATVRRTIDLGAAAPAVVDAEDAGPTFASELNTRVGAEVGLLGQSAAFWAGSAAMFAALALLAFLVIRPAQQVRLSTVNHTGDAVAGFSQRVTGTADQIIAGSERGTQLDRTLDAAGMEIRPGELLVFVLVGSLLGFLIGLPAGGGFLAIVLAFLPALLAIAIVSRKLRRRRDAFAEQLEGTLTVMAGALRAGRGLPQTLDLVAEESPRPTSEEFQRVIIESRVGRDLSRSLEGVAERMKNDDFNWVAEAIAINRELGGDLSEILDNIAAVVRDRNQIRLQVKALAAEGRISGYVLIGLPISLFFYIQIVNPDYGQELFSGAGLVALLAGIAAMAAGALWIRNLVKLNY